MMVADTGNGTESEGGDDASSRPARLAFLVLIMVVSGAANVLLLYAIFHSKKFRHNIQNVIIVNLAVVCLCDCLLNMSLVMGSLISTEWTFGEVLCCWHSFLMNLVLVETTLLLTVLTTDRYMAIKFLQRYDSLISPVRLALVIIFTWVQSFAFSIPFLFDTVYTTFRPKLHTCSVSDQTPITFICFASVLCFLAPAIAIIVIFVQIFRLACKQQHEVKALKTQNHYTDVLMEEPRLSQEMWTVKMMCVLCLLWFIFEMPYIIITYIQQYRNSKELSFSVEYPWGVDIAFIWMRFSYSAIFPCAIFIWKREMWSYVKECIMCRRNNSVIDIKVSVKESNKSAPVREINATVIPPKVRDREQKQEVPGILAFNVPVLFATSEGIHIETPQSGCAESDLYYTEILSRTKKRLPSTLKGKQLDIGDPETEEVALPADTSDYDSSSAGGHVLQTSSAWLPDDHQQTDSQTGREGPPGSPPLQETGDTAGMHGADSGLELSGTVGSSSGRGIQMLLEKSHTHDIHETFRVNSVVTHGSQHIAVQNQPDTVVPHLRDKLDQEVVSSPILSPSTDVVPVLDTPIDNGPKISEKLSSSSEHAGEYGHNLAKAPPRLKPLNSEKKRKGKKAGQGRKKKSGSDDPSPGEKIFKGGGEAQARVVIGDMCAEQVLPTGAEGKNTASEPPAKSGRGHKRTKTSDSQKSLLGSSSSVELQRLKTEHE